MGARNPARYLAPIALIATITVAYLIVHQGLSTKQATTPTSTATVSHAPASHKAGSARYYVVKAGDSLTQISTKTGVPLSILQQLNPGVNPTALQVGQRLTLRR